MIIIIIIYLFIILFVYFVSVAVKKLSKLDDQHIACQEFCSRLLKSSYDLREKVRVRGESNLARLAAEAAASNQSVCFP